MHYLWRLLRLPSPWPRWFLGRVGWIAGARVQDDRRAAAPRRLLHLQPSQLDRHPRARRRERHRVRRQGRDRRTRRWSAGSPGSTAPSTSSARTGWASPSRSTQLRDALADNWAITVFPEGTTTDGQSLLPFKTPMLRVLEPPPPGVMVQPVLLDYGAVGEEIGWIGEESGINNANRILARTGSFPLRITLPRTLPSRATSPAARRSPPRAGGGSRKRWSPRWAPRCVRLPGSCRLQQISAAAAECPARPDRAGHRSPRHRSPHRASRPPG